jgi:hypothetical protein
MSDFANVRAMFARSTAIFSKTTEGVAPEKWLTQPGDDSNHLLWIAGHMVVHRAMAAKVLGQTWEAAWAKLFARGQKRVQGEQYPKPAEVLEAWRDVSEKLTAGLANPNFHELEKPAAKGAPTLDGTVGGTVSFLCFHELYHLGQLGYVRKWLGYDQALG